MRSRLRALLLGTITTLGLLGAASHSARAEQTYLSLGDSIAFGETAFSTNPALGPYADPSNGDRGFVGIYANDLGTIEGTRRPSGRTTRRS